jgi:hypothetical protein
MHRTLKRGTFRAILRDSEIEVGAFLEVLRR